MSNINIPVKGFRFLKNLKRNNQRDWFLEHKGEYEEFLRQPFQEVIIDLGEKLKTEAKGIQFDPKKSIFRINRDTRFSANKDPYKTNIGASFVYSRHNKKDENPGLYLHVEPNNCFVAGGLYMPTGEQLRKIRELIKREPEVFKKIICHPKVKKYFGGLSGERLKKAPQGTDPNHRQIELLKWKQFIYIKRYKDKDFQTGDLAKKVKNEFAAMMPLIEWLEKAQNLW